MDEKGSVGWAKKWHNINLPTLTNELRGAWEQFREEAVPRFYSA